MKLMEVCPLSVRKQLWKWLKKLGYQLEKRIFPLKRLLLTICRSEFNNEYCAVLAARSFGQYWSSRYASLRTNKNLNVLARLHILNP